MTLGLHEDRQETGSEGGEERKRERWKERNRKRSKQSQPISKRKKREHFYKTRITTYLQSWSRAIRSPQQTYLQFLCLSLFCCFVKRWSEKKDGEKYRAGLRSEECFLHRGAVAWLATAAGPGGNRRRKEVGIKTKDCTRSQPSPGAQSEARERIKRRGLYCTHHRKHAALTARGGGERTKKHKPSWSHHNTRVTIKCKNRALISNARQTQFSSSAAPCLLLVLLGKAVTEEQCCGGGIDPIIGPEDLHLRRPSRARPLRDETRLGAQRERVFGR